MSAYPIPAYLNEYTKSWKQNNGNFSLFFHKFVPYDNNSFDSAKNTPLILEKVFCFQSKSLEERITLQNNLVKKSKMGGFVFRAKLGSNLITGIGTNTPIEVGIALDHNLGTPYIPGSTLKGIVRYAYCVNYCRKTNESSFDTSEKGFVALFGSTDDQNASAGGVAFLDAYPNDPKIVQDIMNPHTGSYYKNSSQYPNDTESPIPIKFLVLKKGCSFDFQLIFLNKKVEAYKKELEEAFKTALTEFGIGAKTNAGYGLFRNVQDVTNELIAEEEKKNEEARVKAEAEAKRAAEIAKKEEKEKAAKLEEENKKQLVDAIANAPKGSIQKAILTLQNSKDGVWDFANTFLKKGENEDWSPDELELANLIWKHIKNEKPKKLSEAKKKMYEKIEAKLKK